jgi:hypothetical protein
MTDEKRHLICFNVRKRREEMKKNQLKIFIFVFIIAFLGVAACNRTYAPPAELLGKWNLDTSDPNVIRLLAVHKGQSQMMEFKDDGELIIYTLQNGKIMQTQNNYYKMISPSSFLACETQDQCTQQTATAIIDFSINGDIMTQTPENIGTALPLAYIRVVEETPTT